jgi:hypothetical protein
LTLLLDVDEASLSEHPQVPRDARPRDRKCLGEIAN